MKSRSEPGTAHSGHPGQFGEEIDLEDGGRAGWLGVPLRHAKTRATSPAGAGEERGALRLGVIGSSPAGRGEEGVWAYGWGMKQVKRVKDGVGLREGGSERAALWGLLVNVGLAGSKLVAGIVGHSFALVADAVESMVDIAGSLIVWRALEYGGKPADESHPFGHGKVESLAGLAVGLLVVLAGVGIGVQSVHGIVNPHRLPAWYTVVVLLAVIGVKETMFRVTHRAARASGSSAGMADAWHHRSDAITSLAALVGISVALIGGTKYAAADDWAALVASAVIVVNGALLAREPLGELVDAGQPEIARRCGEVVLEVEGIEAIEQCEARKVGRLYRVIMHAEVDPGLSVSAAHALTGEAKALVRERMPEVASLLIHVEPFEEGTGH